MIIGVLLLTRLFSRANQPGGYGASGRPGPMGGPGYGAGGYGAPGYGGRGGFWQGMLGGLGGAIAGNWLYGQFSGRHHQPDHDYGGTGYTGAEGGALPPDTGADWGGTGGADWGGGDVADTGGDWGGGGGGDWGGGGGGDWGGGGGDWGGGGGGDWT